MAENVETPAGIKPNDIVFDCPHCGKSLAIDGRGAGLMVTCPDCHRDVVVPGLPPDQRASAVAPAANEPTEEEMDIPADVKSLSEALAGSQAKVRRLVASLEEVRERRKFLEKLRAENMARFGQIGKELVNMQNAMDRIVAILQEVTSQKSAGDTHAGTT